MTIQLGNTGYGSNTVLSGHGVQAPRYQLQQPVNNSRSPDTPPVADQRLKNFLRNNPTSAEEFNAQTRQGKLTNSVETLAKALKDAYGDKINASDLEWEDRTLSNIANGSIYSKKLGKDVTFPPEVRAAAQFILENGGSKLFERGENKDGLFNFSELSGYIFDQYSKAPVTKQSQSSSGYI